MPGMSHDITTLPGIFRYLEREARRPDLLRVRSDSGFHPVSTVQGPHRRPLCRLTLMGGALLSASAAFSVK